MKYLMISDIHGSSYFLEKVLAKVKDFDKLIILGDILYHGPRNNLPNGYEPKNVIEILSAYKENIIAVRGNCDAKIDLDVLGFDIPDHKLITFDNVNVFLTHGDIYNHDNMPEDKYINALMHGHTHVNVNYNIDGKKVINLGSLSIPKDNHHSYAIIQDNKVRIYDLLTDEIILEETLG